MRVLIFGASGMVGQGVLRECLLASDVTEVVSVARSPLPKDGVQASLPERGKLREIVRPDLFASHDFSSIAEDLSGFDACFFPLGVSSFRMSEEDYTRITRDLTLSIARTLVSVSPAVVFIYVSGEGTDAASRTMWSRVKGETENALLTKGFRAAYMFRPGLIVAKHGVKWKSGTINFFYRALWPLVAVVGRFPRIATDTETVGQAMLRMARETPSERVWNTPAINRMGREESKVIAGN